MDPQKGDPLYRYQVDLQKGVPGGSPKRRFRWIPKMAFQMDPQKGDPLYSSGWILKKAFQVDPQKGDPLYPYPKSQAI